MLVLFCSVFTIVVVASRSLKQGMEMRAKFFMCVFSFLNFIATLWGVLPFSTWMFVELKICFLPGGTESTNST